MENARRNLRTFYNAISSEVFQIHETKRDIVFKILNSNRLLCEHVEVLELALKDIENNYVEPTEIFNFTQSTFLVAVAAITSHINSYLKYIVPVVSVGFISVYSLKLFYKIKKQLIIQKLESLLNIIDRYEICVKRNLIFLNEMNLLKTNMEIIGQFDIEKEREQTFINSIKTVTTLFYNNLQKIEALHLLPFKYNTVYEKLDNLLECELFKRDFLKLSTSEAKQFYNIFALTQSQYLLRFGLTSANHLSFKIAFFDFNQIRNRCYSHIDEHSKLFEKITKFSDKNSSKKNYFVRSFQSNESSNLKNESLIVSTKIMVLANECRKFDCDFQNLTRNNDELIYPLDENQKLKHLQFLERLKIFENSIASFSNEFQRFLINYNKFTNNKYQIENNLATNCLEMAHKYEQAKQDVDTILLSEQTKQNFDDDFFGIDVESDDAIYQDYKMSTYDDELNKINSRVIKTYFKPVLNQLKKKIEPINAKMKEKENTILKLKGLDVAEVSDIHLETETDFKNNSDDSETDDESHKQKNCNLKRLDEKYCEARVFLAKKMQIGLIPTVVIPTMNIVTSDDIIE